LQVRAEVETAGARVIEAIKAAFVEVTFEPRATGDETQVVDTTSSYLAMMPSRTVRFASLLGSRSEIGTNTRGFRLKMAEF